MDAVSEHFESPDMSSLLEAIQAAIRKQGPFFVEKDLTEEGIKSPSIMHVTGLVLWILSRQHISKSSYPPMLLLMHILERFLRDLLRRDCDIQPVAFQEDVAVLTPYQRLVHHYVCTHLVYLSNALSRPRLSPLFFKSSSCQEFVLYVHNHLPNIALCFSKGVSQQLKVRFYTFMARCWQFSCPVSYLENISFAGSSVRGLLHRCELPLELVRKLEDSFDCCATDEYTQRFLHLSSSSSDMVLLALKRFVHMPVWALFCRMIALTLALQKHLELCQRALQPPSSFDSADLVQFLDELYAECYRSPVRPGGLQAHLDLVDVTLLLHLLLRLAAAAAASYSCENPPLQRLSQLLELSPTLLRDCSHSWCVMVSSDIAWDMTLLPAVVQWLQSLPKFHGRVKKQSVATELPPVQLCQCLHAPHNSTSQQQHAPQQAAASLTTDIVLFPIHSAVLSSATQLNIPHLSVKSESVRAVLHANQRFFEKFHWHSARPLKHDSGGEQIPYHVAKKIQSFTLRMKAYSASLIGIRQPRLIIKSPESTLATVVLGSTNLSTHIAEQKLSDDFEALSTATELSSVMSIAKNIRSAIVQQSDLREPHGALTRLKNQLTAALHKYPSACFVPLLMRLDLDLLTLHCSSSGPSSSCSDMYLALDPISQLRLCGEFMNWREPATANSKKEALLKEHGFVPEKWQRKMIRSIDRQLSIVVSAPTSSGKTFISFYVIESVLKRDPRSAIAFVVPTKALVNQVYAEILGSFRVPDSHPYELVGLFTADNRVNVDNCSVLVVSNFCTAFLLLL